MPDAVDIAEYVGSAATALVAGYSSAAGLTFLIWDVLVTFPDEVQLVWSRPHGWSHWLYAFIRYAPLLAEIVYFAFFVVPHAGPDLRGKSCKTSIIAGSVILESVILAVEVVLLVRVHALYDRSRTVLIALLAGLAASFCGTFAGMHFTADSVLYNARCNVQSSGSPPIRVLFWLFPVAFEAALFAMTLLKFREGRREGLGRRPILDTVVCDGTWAFALTLVVMVANAVIYTAFSGALSGIFYFWVMSILSFIGSHVLRNLRRIAHEQSLPWEFMSEPSDICFGRDHRTV